MSPLPQLRAELVELRAHCLEVAEKQSAKLSSFGPEARNSLMNLLHYLALRQRDLRKIQKELAQFGLSSLGRLEGNVIHSLDEVIARLHEMLGEKGETSVAVALPDGMQAEELLHHTRKLLGPKPDERHVHIMVTAPTAAEGNQAWMESLLKAGLDCLRINCSHGSPQDWESLLRSLRLAQRRVVRPCRVLMDLAGPKVRTLAFGEGPRVVRFKSSKDLFGRVVDPLRITLMSLSHEPMVSLPPNTVFIPARWMAKLEVGSVIRFEDARRKKRQLTVCRVGGLHAEAWLEETTYLSPDVVLHLVDAEGDALHVRPQRCHWIPAAAEEIEVPVGGRILLAKGKTSPRESARRVPRIGCTLHELFNAVSVGQRVLFDDGKIETVCEAASRCELVLRVIGAKRGTARFRGDMGINVPDSELSVPCLSDKDVADLAFAVAHADVVGLSFVRGPKDVQDLLSRMADVPPTIGVVLKIETKAGFSRLPEILVASLGSRPLGVMIARGDLAVECGYERLAEVQEEILWLCEAAHLPVIWATQVLETLAKTGFPSRAEVTDAAMSVRAECVMLNKGPFIESAVRCLDEILRKMETHQHKKRQLYRPLSISFLSRPVVERRDPLEARGANLLEKRAQEEQVS